MKVYIVIRYERYGDWYDIGGVFSTFQKAVSYVEKKYPEYEPEDKDKDYFTASEGRIIIIHTKDVKY